MEASLKEEEIATYLFWECTKLDLFIFYDGSIKDARSEKENKVHKLCARTLLVHSR